MAKIDDIRWGILGPGAIAGLFAEDLARTPGARCVAVASRDMDRAKAFAAQHGIKTAYGDYASMAADPEVDIVYIASPHSHHHEHGRLMLEGGKPVMMEKPFAMNAVQAADLISLARQRGIFVMDAMWTLCNPLLRRLADRVAAGEIGTPRAFYAFIGPEGVPKDSRIGDPALGGSFTLECMVYPLNILAGIAPNLLIDANVTSSALLSDRGIDSMVSIQLKNADGFATMTGGYVLGAQGAAATGVHLIGDKGWLSITDSLYNPGCALFSANGNPMEEIVEPASAERYRWEIEEAGRCLREGRNESALVPHDLTLGVMRLLDKVVVQTKGRTLP